MKFVFEGAVPAFHLQAAHRKVDHANQILAPLIW